MKYKHSIERSMEYFRMALPLMTRQAAAVHPVSYAVWYEYASAENPALRSDVDAKVKELGQLDEAATEALYRRHVVDLDPDKARQVADGFNRVLSGMAQSASVAEGQTGRYHANLQQLTAELAVGGPAPDAGRLNEVLQDTAATQAAIGALQARLEESAREIDALRDEVRRARRESLIDSLTGLANRRAFEQRLAAAIAVAEAGGGTPPCLVLADIDHFKRINDKYGHGFGDQVLRAVAKVVEAKLPPNALAARIGGEEFAMLLPATSLQAAQVLADKVRTMVAASRVRRAGHTEADARITLSFGVASWRSGEDATDLFDRADKALYGAKRAGRDCVILAPLA